MKTDKKKCLQGNSIKEEESSSSEDDENAVLLTEDLEKGFLKVLSRLKKKDSNLYNESINYFSLEDSKAKASDKALKSQQGYKEWLKGQITSLEDSEMKEELEALHDYWTKSDINKDEQFLRDYILNKKFLEHDDSFSLEKELEKLSEEEKEEEEQAIFEEKYNCRFENPDKDFMLKYPLTLKKASGKKRSYNSFTETDKSIDNNDSSFGKKRKHVTPDEEEKMLKTDLTSIKEPAHLKSKKIKNDITITIKIKRDSSEQRQTDVILHHQRSKNLKNKFSITEKVTKADSEKKQKSVDAKGIKNTPIKVGPNKSKINRSQLKRIIAATKISENKIVADKRKSRAMKLKHKFESNKVIKQNWHKNQHIKQPQAFNEIKHKVNNGKTAYRARKRRHRYLKRLMNNPDKS